jgi:hypothetical protein
MIVLLLLAVLFLAVVVYTMVLVFFRPWLIMRREQDQRQDLESVAAEPRESPESATEGPEEAEAPPDTERRSWWRRYFGF